MRAKRVKCGFFGGLDENMYQSACHAAESAGFSIDEGGALVKGPGFKKFLTCDGVVNGIWAGSIGGEKILAYAGGAYFNVYKLETQTNVKLGLIGSTPAKMFEFNGCLYILNSVNYYKYDGTSLSEVKGYAPLVAISTPPSGGGTPYEAANMLTKSRRQLFSPDGTSTFFILAETAAGIEKITAGGVELAESAYSYSQGMVEIFTPPAKGVNTLEVFYTMSSSSRTEILSCTNATLFGSNADVRVFLWGNSQRPCRRYHSELADGMPTAEYFPVTSFTEIGASPITDIVQQYDKQLIFTKDSAYFSYCEIKTSLSGQQYASFPVYPLNPAKGNLIYGSGCTMEGLPVTLCHDGLNVWQPGVVESEKNAVCFSSPINAKIKPYAKGGSVSSLLFNNISAGCLYFTAPGNMYVYNYKRKCFFCLSGLNALRMCYAYGNMYIAANDMCIYTLSPDEKGFNASYVTHYSPLGYGGAKTIKEVTLTVEAGEATAGKLRVDYISGNNTSYREQSFSIPASAKGRVVKVRIPVYAPLVHLARFTFSSPSGSLLKILGWEATVLEKGEI
ncbi:MAG: hypothetical protein WC143_08230 [Eubacteriales bacterium]